MKNMMIILYLLGSLVSVGLSINYQLRKGNSLKRTELIVVILMAIGSWVPVLFIAGAWIRHFVLTVCGENVPQND